MVGSLRSYKSFICFLFLVVHSASFAQDTTCASQKGAVEDSELTMLQAAMATVDLKTCPLEGKAINVKETLNFLSVPGMLDKLQKGATAGRLVLLKSAVDLDEEEKAVMHAIAPLTSFKDELAENNVAVPDLSNRAELKGFKVIISKTMYFIPKATSSMMSPEQIADYKYQVACQPGVESEKTIIEKVDAPNTFRFKKEIMKVLFKSIKIGVQMKTSEVAMGESFTKISALDGLPANRIVLFERTKRDISKEDGNKVVKGAVVVRDVKGGVLSTVYTVILNDSIPTIFASIAKHFGDDDAAAENNESAIKTRKFFHK